MKASDDPIVRLSHMVRCLILGCYYGREDSNECVFCGEPRPHHELVGRSVISDLQKKLADDQR